MIWKPNCTNERCWKRLFTKLCIMIYIHNRCIKLCIIHIRVYNIHIKIYVIKLLCMIIYFISFWYHMLFITSHMCIWKTYFFLNHHTDTSSMIIYSGRFFYFDHVLILHIIYTILFEIIYWNEVSSKTHK